MTTVLDDYTARSSQELTVSKGQHVRIVQRLLPNAPDWCLIRLLNDHHHQQHQSSPSSLAASSTTITSGLADLSIAPSTKYTEGLVPAAILKATKSSSQLPPPLNAGRSEQGNHRRRYMLLRSSDLSHDHGGQPLISIKRLSLFH